MVQFGNLMQYEFVAVVDPKNDGKDVQKLLTVLLEKEGFAISEMNPLGKRKLAYPIKKQTEGFYFSSTIASAKARPQGLLARLKMEEAVLRVLVLKKEKTKNSAVKKPQAVTKN